MSPPPPGQREQFGAAIEAAAAGFASPDCLAQTLHRVRQALQSDMVAVWQAGTLPAPLAVDCSPGFTPASAGIDAEFVERALRERDDAPRWSRDEDTSAASALTVALNDGEGPALLVAIGWRVVPSLAPADGALYVGLARQLAASIGAGRRLKLMDAEVDRAEALAEVGRIVSLGLDRSGAADELLIGIRRLLNVDAMAVSAGGDHDQRSHLLAAQSVEQLGFSQGNVLAWLAEFDLETAKEISVCDIRDCGCGHPFRDAAVEAGYRGLAMLPLAVRGSRVGMLFLFSRSADAIGSGQRELLQPLASQMAAAVRTALLVEENAKRVQQSATLAELAQIVHSSLEFEWVLPRFARELQQVLTLDRLTITLLAPMDDGEITSHWAEVSAESVSVDHVTVRVDELGSDDPFRTGRFLWGRLSRHPSELGEQDGATAEPFESAIVVPVMARDLVVATVSVERRAADAYDNADLQLLQQVAAVVGPAAENLRLFGQLNERAERIGILSGVAKAVAQGLHIDDFLPEICAQIHPVVPFTEARIIVRGDDGEGLQSWDVRPWRGAFPLTTSGDGSVAGDSGADEGSVDLSLPPESDVQRRVFPLGSERNALFVLERIEGEPFSAREIDILEETAALLTVGVETDRMYRAARWAAESDGLTGLANHGRFREDLSRELSRSRRSQHHFSILMLDIDGFKLVNDTFGHAAGDKVLRHVAEVLSSVTRDSDIAARIGGDEFAVLLPETDSEGAEAICSRILAGMQEIGGHLTHVSVSLGIATYPTHGEAAESLASHADVAMYAAKRAGGNRWQTWSLEMAEEQQEALEA